MIKVEIVCKQSAFSHVVERLSLKRVPETVVRALHKNLVYKQSEVMFFGVRVYGKEACNVPDVFIDVTLTEKKYADDNQDWVVESLGDKFREFIYEEVSLGIMITSSKGITFGTV